MTAAPVDGAAAVDLVVNCFERTYREVLVPGFFERIQRENRFAFAGRVALINNVEDLADARARAQRLLDAGELTDVVVVAEHLDAALRATGLTRRQLGRIPHYTDCALVAVTVQGAPWLVYWDADLHLVEPVDWITPSMALMERDRRVLVACPNNWHYPEPGHTAIEARDDFAFGFEFSDLVFLARRAELARPIYGERSVAMFRFPLAHIGHIFEARLDAHLRRHGRLRAFHLGSTYRHTEEGIGVTHPAHSRFERVRRMAYQAALLAVRTAPPRLRRAHLRDL